MREEEKIRSFTDIVILEEINNFRLSKIFLYEKYTNSDQIFSRHLQIVHMSKLQIIYFSLIQWICTSIQTPNQDHN